MPVGESLRILCVKLLFNFKRCQKLVIRQDAQESQFRSTCTGKMPPIIGFLSEFAQIAQNRMINKALSMRTTLNKMTYFLFAEFALIRP